MIWWLLGAALAVAAVVAWVRWTPKRYDARLVFEFHESNCPDCTPQRLCANGERLREAAFPDIT